jgi:hypothetical protein
MHAEAPESTRIVSSRLYPFAEAAEVLGLDVGALAEAVAFGELPVWRRDGEARLRGADLVVWMEREREKDVPATCVELTF